MLDALVLMILAALSWIGWLKGMVRPRAQFWVKFIGPIGLAWMSWYFLFVLLPRTQPALLAGNMQTGHWTLVFMIGGVWALLAKPRPETPKKTDRGTRTA